MDDLLLLCLLLRFQNLEHQEAGAQQCNPTQRASSVTSQLSLIYQFDVLKTCKATGCISRHGAALLVLDSEPDYSASPFMVGFPRAPFLLCLGEFNKACCENIHPAFLQHFQHLEIRKFMKQCYQILHTTLGLWPGLNSVAQSSSQCLPVAVVTCGVGAPYLQQQ